jgi:hypothetical protein
MLCAVNSFFVKHEGQINRDRDSDTGRERQRKEEKKGEESEGLTELFLHRFAEFLSLSMTAFL